jgi:DNA-binding transcriptional LysR family regulator
MARAGLAVVLMHGLTVPDPQSGLVLRPLVDGDAGARTIEVATLEGRRWPPADTFADLIVEHFAEPRPSTSP